MFAQALWDVIAMRVSIEAASWLRAAQPGSDRAADAIAFAGLSRRMGQASLVLTRDERQSLQELAVVDGWELDQAARAAWLWVVCAQASNPAAWVDELFRQGDGREKIAILRTLPYLPSPERFVALAREACRSNTLPVFEALACDNPFAARHFDDEGFNQLVMKAVFNGIALGRVRGLKERLNDDLARMARDYARERQSAGRVVPRDLEILVDIPLGTRLATIHSGG